MKKNDNNNRYFRWSMLPLSIFLGLAYLVQMEYTLQLDSKLIHYMQQYEATIIYELMLLFSFVGSTLPVMMISIVSMVLLYYKFRDKRQLLFFALTMGGSVLINHALKHLFLRARPEFSPLVVETGYSFPSGHAMAAVTLYGLLIYMLSRLCTTKRSQALVILIGVTCIICIGLSRIYLGVHYPSDVIGGYFMSLCWLMLTIGLYRHVTKEKSIPHQNPRMEEVS